MDDWTALCEILQRDFELDPARLRPEARLVEDLELDSLDGVDLIVALERRLGLRLPDRAIEQAGTLGEVVALLDQLRSSSAR